MPDSSVPHSRHKLFFIASLGANVALGLALQKGWLDSVSDGWVAVICLIPISSFLWWLWIHPSVKKRRYLLYSHPKMSLTVFLIISGAIGTAVGGFLWWATHRQEARAESKVEAKSESTPSATAIGTLTQTATSSPSPASAPSSPLVAAQSATSQTTPAVLPTSSPSGRTPSDLLIERNLKDPTFSETSKEVILILGDNAFSYLVAALAKGITVDVPMSIGGPLPIRLTLKEQKILVTAEVSTWDSGSPSAAIYENQFSVQPSNWDRNKNENALEIVDEHQRPVFQLVYERPSQIKINGIFRTPRGNVFISDDGFLGNVTKDRQKSLSLKPIFKYPSWKFPGVYVN